MVDGARMVNFKYSRIFNGGFEKQKSTKNEERFAEMCANCAWASRVYHDCINYDPRLPEIYHLLKQRLRHKSAALDGRSADGAPPAPRNGWHAPLRQVRHPGNLSIAHGTYGFQRQVMSHITIQIGL